MATRDTRLASDALGQNQDKNGSAKAENAASGASRTQGISAEIELSLSDLIGDERGEVVLFNDSGFHTLALRTEARVVERGVAQRHVTAGGDDVSGFRYLTFENGLTLYYQEGVDLIVQAPAAPRDR
jgi:hypothetical protein